MSLDWKLGKSRNHIEEHNPWTLHPVNVSHLRSISNGIAFIEFFAFRELEPQIAARLKWNSPFPFPPDREIGVILARTIRVTRDRLRNQPSPEPRLHTCPLRGNIVRGSFISVCVTISFLARGRVSPRAIMGEDEFHSRCFPPLLPLPEQLAYKLFRSFPRGIDK